MTRWCVRAPRTATRSCSRQCSRIRRLGVWRWLRATASGRRVETSVVASRLMDPTCTSGRTIRRTEATRNLNPRRPTPARSGRGREVADLTRSVDAGRRLTSGYVTPTGRCAVTRAAWCRSWWRTPSSRVPADRAVARGARRAGADRGRRCRRPRWQPAPGGLVAADRRRPGGALGRAWRRCSRLVRAAGAGAKATARAHWADSPAAGAVCSSGEPRRCHPPRRSREHRDDHVRGQGPGAPGSVRLGVGQGP